MQYSLSSPRPHPAAFFEKNQTFRDESEQPVFKHVLPNIVTLCQVYIVLIFIIFLGW